MNRCASWTMMTAVLLAAGGCGRSDDASNPATGFAIRVAPLQLSTVGGATWKLEVFNGDPDNGGELVVARDTLSSDRFGSPRGDISYVSPCDADAGEHHVRLTLTELRDTNGEIIDAATWRNPTPVTQTATCIENADTPVTFNLVIMREANQGFFDIGVTFDDIFCSAKFDCLDENNDPMKLLHNGAERDTTMVLGFACTAGGGETTWLHMSDVYIECTNGAQVTTHWMSPKPLTGEGNQGAVAPIFFQTAVYVGDEALPGVDKCYWNLAFGLNQPGPANCVLKVDATASTGSWAASNGQSPSNTVYPYVHYEVPITGSEGQLMCGRHGLDDASLRVSTRYTEQVGTALPWERQCGNVIDDDERVRCGGDVITVGNVTAAFTHTPSGVSVAFGASRSPVYVMEEPYQVSACCLNPCCEE